MLCLAVKTKEAKLNEMIMNNSKKKKEKKEKE